MEYSHTPVLLAEVLRYTHSKKGSTFVDCTLGGAGHAEAILDLVTPEGFLLGIDADFAAIEAAKVRLARFSQQSLLIRSNFGELENVLSSQGLGKVDGFLFDLGISSAQVDNESRGFTYKADAGLDMRMDSRSEKTAEFIINNYSEVELSRIIQSYGGEKWASRIAEFIIKSRQQKTIKTSGQLVDIIKAAIPASARRRGGHPAKRTFQAIRIEVNDELSNLKKALAVVVDHLKIGGRVLVISYHSLEDKIVKDWMREVEGVCVCPPILPVCACDKKMTMKIITKRPIKPSLEEIDRNPRSKSARLRVAERV